MFTRNGVTQLAGTVIVAGAFGLVAFATAGTAAALSSTDDTFLTQISEVGIAYDDAYGAISIAHDVCYALDDGADPVDLGTELLDETDLTTSQASMFIVTSVGNYCPENSVLFG
jgi:hypothetical protein